MVDDPAERSGFTRRTFLAGATAATLAGPVALTVGLPGAAGAEVRDVPEAVADLVTVITVALDGVHRRELAVEGAQGIAGAALTAALRLADGRDGAGAALDEVIGRIDALPRDSAVRARLLDAVRLAGASAGLSGDGGHGGNGGAGAPNQPAPSPVTGSGGSGGAATNGSTGSPAGGAGGNGGAGGAAATP
jgi:hypothetical protein